MSNAPRLRVGSWIVSPDLNLIERGDRSIKIEPRSMDVLVYLAQRAGEVVPVGDLLNSVWRGVVVTESSVYAAIKQLRRAFAVPGETECYIETIPKRGYRLMASVDWLPSPPLPEPAVRSERPVSAAASRRGEAGEALVVASTELPERRDRPHGVLGPWLTTAALATALCAALVPAALYFLSPPSPALRAIRITIAAPGHGRRGWGGGFVGGAQDVPPSLAISPDGTRIAYTAEVDGRSQVWLRPNDDALAAHPLPGTDDASGLFWSPDSRYLAFVAGGKLKTIPIEGGRVKTLADAAPIGMRRGGTWSRDGTLLFTSSPATIGRVTADGPTPPPAPKPADVVGLIPRMLPDGDHFLYDDGNGALSVGSLTTAKRVRLREIGGLWFSNIPNFAYADGFLLYLVRGTLKAQPFDLAALALRGDAVPIVDHVGEFSVSTTGVLVYVQRRATAGVGVPRRHLVWVDRSGRAIGMIPTPEEGYRLPALSPDGGRVAVSVPGLDNLPLGDIWTIDTGGTMTRLTFDGGVDASPAWSRDGARIVYASALGNANGAPNRVRAPNRLYERAANGTGSAKLLFSGESEEFVPPWDWSPDGRFVLFGRMLLRNPVSRADLWVLPLADGKKAHPLLESRGLLLEAQFSPNGRWIAYTTDELGGNEVVVRPFPHVEPSQWQISVGGGMEPRWRADGRELYYIDPHGTIMAVDVDTAGKVFKSGRPRTLVHTDLTGTTLARLLVRPDDYYGVAPDGQRFLINESGPGASAATAKADEAPAAAPEEQIHEIVNWTAVLEDRKTAGAAGAAD